MDTYGSDLKASLIDALKNAEEKLAARAFKAVIMHDFSLDRLVRLDNLDAFIDSARDIHSRKGGIYPHSYQSNQQGGCAANTATTLGRLGVDTRFICRTDELGLALIDFYLHKKAGVNIDHVKLGGRLADSTALEIGDERINIMINDGDSFTPFGFDDLEERDFEAIQHCDLVGMFDWCMNRKGTDLASRLLDYMQGRGIPTYYDTSDPAPRCGEMPELMEKAVAHPALNFMNVNENELHQYACRKMVDQATWENIQETARILKDGIHANLCVHTSRFAAMLDAQGETVVPAFKVNPLRTTGAGDNWNAGNILGILLGLETAQRLLLANAVAANYITSPNCERPTLTELINFLEDPNLELKQI
ncbi:MAG: carbohydrate kinase family protein [Anaerolineaceae bacterium]|nr:carbohydrate kinase family protein [Anaerolineaceae bacterium]